MKWARRKPEISPSRPSLITRVLSPVSWFSKFKQKGDGSPEAVPPRKEQRNKLDFPTPTPSPSPSSMAGGLKQGRFYGEDDDDDDDAYWRLSFGEERVEARRSTGGMIGSHVWCDPGDEFLAPGSAFRTEEYRNFNEMVMDVKKRGKKDKQKVSLQENDVYRSRNVSDHGSRKSSYGVVRGINQPEGYSRSRLKDIFAVESDDVVKITRGYRKSPAYQPEKYSPNLGPVSGSNGVSILEWQSLEEKRVKEIKVKAESQNRVTRKAKHNTRVKAYSPRTECKIRALEEMRKAKIKLKKMKERKEEGEFVGRRAVFDSFAVVKSSFNPQRDFKDSMVEMIRVKGIRRPEELEELLACYLTLNADEYHDLIIKVFKQVWLEMNSV